MNDEEVSSPLLYGTRGRDGAERLVFGELLGMIFITPTLKTSANFFPTVRIRAMKPVFGGGGGGVSKSVHCDAQGFFLHNLAREYCCTAAVEYLVQTAVQQYVIRTS